MDTFFVFDRLCFEKYRDFFKCLRQDAINISPVQRDLDGFDVDGFDEDGFDRYGFNKDGFNRAGFAKWSIFGYGQLQDIPDWKRFRLELDFLRSYYRQQVYDNGIHSGIYLDDDGFDQDGFDQDGFDREGVNRFAQTRGGIFVPQDVLRIFRYPQTSVL